MFPVFYITEHIIEHLYVAVVSLAVISRHCSSVENWLVWVRRSFPHPLRIKVGTACDKTGE